MYRFFQLFYCMFNVHKVMDFKKFIFYRTFTCIFFLRMNLEFWLVKPSRTTMYAHIVLMLISSKTWLFLLNHNIKLVFKDLLKIHALKKYMGYFLRFWEHLKYLIYISSYLSLNQFE